jgi:hypothetical protein
MKCSPVNTNILAYMKCELTDQVYTHQKLIELIKWEISILCHNFVELLTICDAVTNFQVLIAKALND